MPWLGGRAQVTQLASFGPSAGSFGRVFFFSRGGARVARSLVGFYPNHLPQSIIGSVRSFLVTKKGNRFGLVQGLEAIPILDCACWDANPLSMRTPSRKSGGWSRRGWFCPLNRLLSGVPGSHGENIKAQRSCRGKRIC